MTRKALSETEKNNLCEWATAIIDRLPPQRRIAKFKWGGLSYCAVRTTRGMQIQTPDRRRLVAEVIRGWRHL